MQKLEGIFDNQKTMHRESWVAASGGLNGLPSLAKIWHRLYFSGSAPYLKNRGDSTRAHLARFERGTETMMSLGIDRNSFLAYEGMFLTGRGIWPSPVITSVAVQSSAEQQLKGPGH